jgi:hypothetical protein
MKGHLKGLEINTAGGKAIENKRIVRNWIPIELHKRVLVDNDTVIVIGLTGEEVKELLG